MTPPVLGGRLGKLRVLASQGKSIATCAKLLGVTPARAKQMATAHGIAFASSKQSVRKDRGPDRRRSHNGPGTGWGQHGQGGHTWDATLAEMREENGGYVESGSPRTSRMAWQPGPGRPRIGYAAIGVLLYGEMSADEFIAEMRRHWPTEAPKRGPVAKSPSYSPSPANKRRKRAPSHEHAA